MVNEPDNMNFELPPDMLDEIQKNIEDIIQGFPISDNNKIDVIKKINFMYSQTRHMSLTDSLTGLQNRRSFESNLEREFLRAQRYKSDLSLALIDIDFFKKVNDTYGHLCGDYVLKEVSYLCLESFRKTDMVFRYGGEELVVILTETTVEKALIPLERLRKQIESYPFNSAGSDFKVTISIGLSSCSENVHTQSELLDFADKALYVSKENGRNQLNIMN